VAVDLLGCTLHCRREEDANGDAGSVVAGRIVETEAYVGEEDRACHAHSGRTPRNAVMYGPPGFAYVYFVYGMHDMMNVVCQPQGRPEAVLVRAIEPVHGLDVMRGRRRGVQRDRDLGNGPGKLCRALGITRDLNGADLCIGTLWITHGGPRDGERLVRSPRIGVDYAGPDARRLLRFYLAGNPHVSRTPR
jgi:DNA-3-methyladenine glycosylase